MSVSYKQLAPPVTGVQPLLALGTNKRLSWITDRPNARRTDELFGKFPNDCRAAGSEPAVFVGKTDATKRSINVNEPLGLDHGDTRRREIFKKVIFIEKSQVFHLRF